MWSRLWRAMAAGACGLLLAAGVVAHAGWDPVPPADLAATDSTANPGVDAEILFSRQYLTEEDSVGPINRDQVKSIFEGYVRAKIYTQKGVEDRGKFRIQYPHEQWVRGVEARVVKADGRTIDLKKSEMTETTLVKWGGRRYRQIAFAFPDLTPGDIIEYRWKQYRDDATYFFATFCQENVPVREYRFNSRNMTHQSSVAWRNLPGAEGKKQEGVTVVARNLPAFEEEEYMPPEREFRGWLYLTWTDALYSEEDMWKLVSTSVADDFALKTRPSGALKAKAAELTAGAQTDDEKLRRLYEFCQKEIVNFDWVNSAEFQAARNARLKGGDQSPAKTLERKSAWASEIDELFAALARGAGYEVRVTRNAARDDFVSLNFPKSWAFVNRRMVAVKVGQKWTFHNPGAMFAPYGLLDWQDQGVPALICEPSKRIIEATPMAEPALSQARRKGRFTLDPEGTLTGEIEETFTGHLAMQRKDDAWGETVDESEKSLRDAVAKRLPNAEITDITWENRRALEMPFVVRYRVRIPGYAEQVGSRLAVAPAFFAAGRPAVFAAETRKFPIFFPYAWEEHDDVEIIIPEGYELDRPSAPSAVGDPASVVGARYKIQYAPKSRALRLQRDFSLGAQGAVAFRQESYPALKNLFEGLHKSDTHSILIKPKAAPAAAPAPAATPAPAAAPAPAPATPNT